ncbi:MAG: DUF3592 domain-containing protein [Polyangiaceae bacterium]|nr:DUF3592 domain-containing protein [Polyangiaceae bacterium]
MIFGGAFTFLPLLMLAMMLAILRPPWEDWALDERGVRTDARSVEVRETSTEVNDESLYEIVVAFEDARGLKHKATVTTTNDEVIARAREKATLTIEYDREKPSRARLPGEASTSIGGMIFLPLGFVAFGLPLFLFGLVSALRAQRLYRRGHCALARVYEVVPTASSVNDEPVMRMLYAFSTADGEAKGGWKTVEPLAIGETLWVVYDPNQPSRNMPSQA